MFCSKTFLKPSTSSTSKWQIHAAKDFAEDHVFPAVWDWFFDGKKIGDLQWEVP
jgi:hypothetical protein